MDNSTTVLIADNSEEFCSSLTAELQKAGGFQVIATAGDGEQAVRMITQQKPQVVVLDMMLPKRDGIAVLKAIERIRPRQVQIYSIDRATPEKSLQKVPVEELRAIGERVKALGIDINVAG